MSATDELRQLLDERGVVWSKGRYDRREFTRWYIRNNNGFISASFRDVFAGENGKPDLRCEFYDITPEQAVEATLGRGTCKWEPADFITEGEWWNTSCGESFTWEPDGTPNYCPNCGRKIVE